ncbi:Uncharacterised protein [Salmonella enterica subsp. enterica]|uniref:Uncharacterized protein n=1 Tax=Salmonella enterica I TaxID=59201 RepID=A0A447PLY9_SALET|nr:Uncharacterised protein [Salmonella enterica subsp. enterica]
MAANQKCRINAHFVTDAVIRILQHQCNDAFHCAVAVFGEITRNGRKQRLEEVVFPQLLIGFKTVPRLQQLQRLFEQARGRNVV